jgi:hypothetical protein
VDPPMPSSNPTMEIWSPQSSFLLSYLEDTLRVRKQGARHLRMRLAAQRQVQVRADGVAG